MANDERSGRGWDRGKMTLRLSSERSAALRELVSDVPDATPTDAIDIAIELAKSARRSELSAAPANQEPLAAGLAEFFGAHFDDMASALADLRQEVAELRAILTAGQEQEDELSATPTDEGAPLSPFEAAASLATWLAAEAASRGLPMPDSAVIRARVIATKQSDSGAIALILAAELVAVDKSKAEPSAGQASRVALSATPIAGGTSALEFESRVCLWCQNTDGQWDIKIHPFDRDGKVGGLIATARA
ncbi:hypothetical protein [Paraburkholderia sp. BL21I4N1]|uniref:hypothetical protein n=1 Tax=Paraburkholderia sp. BL21I4N1 TaxID=1938801 RepID=UPI000CFB92ED|nr:hypothetical protein [Paraburkholderia sp. BL21I4N1]PQV48588.1 hypothetical protein B0G83_108115 [Paraburkholderia sp. BL21I4N1]